MYIPAGIWKGTNGEEGNIDLNFKGLELFDGSAFGRPITGRWEPVSGSLSFVTTDGSGQMYKGALLTPRSNIPQAADYLIAGHYEGLSGSGGWYAEQNVVP